MSNPDWLPPMRLAALAMARSWLSPMRSKGESIWGMDAEKIAKFEDAITTVENELAVPENLRNAVTNERLKGAFGNLTQMMRDIKKRYFFVPPLTNSDLISLGLKPKDTTPTPIGKPVGKVAIKTTYTADGDVQIHLTPKDETAEESKAKYGFRIYYGTYSSSDVPPVSGNDLKLSKFSRKKKLLFTFPPEDKGKTIFFCARYENSKGDEGELGDMVSALIP